MANRGPGRNKFKWTKEQDVKLIETLQELRNEGEIRPDTYLKAGSLTKIHEKLEQKLPGSGIQKKPHIESRMRVLRENFNIVHDLLTGPNCSGFGRDPETKMVTAEDAVWDAYLTSHPEAKKFRDVPIKYYDELSMIFGKDRAIGNLAETPADVVEELENQEVNDTMETSQIPVNASSNDSQLPPNSVFDSDVTSRRQKRKRDDATIFVEGVQSAARIIASEIRESSCRLSRALGEEANENKKIIYNELKKLFGLTMTERHRAHFLIGCDSSKVSLFFSVPDEEREIWVKSLLEFA
ncbi:uncharacterized protein M6B38_309870 [Iris pallida]|uniref:Myb/SANT-like domain-containing protein n=1 Tax=Iris pallida TaxID=29817 RepID=A0AAX6HHF7_IRIPA|nr:uncharacterized protein M6B38_309870 [Iris pallida]